MRPKGAESGIEDFIDRWLSHCQPLLIDGYVGIGPVELGEFGGAAPADFAVFGRMRNARDDLTQKRVEPDVNVAVGPFHRRE